MMEANADVKEEGASKPAILPLVESQPATEPTFMDALALFARRKRLVATVTGIAMAIGIVVSLLLPVRYTATTKILTPQQTQSTAAFLMSQLALNPSAANPLLATGGTLSLRNPNDLYMGLLASRPIADAIIEKFGLADVYHAKDVSSARRALASNTKIASDKSTLISVSVTDRDKKRAAAIANAYPEQLRVLTKNLAVTEASQRRLFYEEQLKDAKEDLVTAELAFQRIEQQKGLVQLDAQTKALITSLADLHAQIAAKEVQLQALRSYSTERNPEVELLESQLASLQDQTARLEERRDSPPSAGLDLGNVAGAGAEYLRAEHELEYRQALYDLLMKQYDAARLDEAKDAAIIQVVEEAIPPDQKSAPKRTLIVLIFAALGMFAGLSYVLGKKLIENHPQVSRLLAEFKSVPVHE